MYPQLMGTAGYRLQLEALSQWVRSQQPVSSQGGLSLLIADFLTRPIRPVGDQGKIDLACVAENLTAGDGLIGLVGFALTKLAAELALRRLRQGHQHDTGGGAVQPVNHKDLRALP